MAGGDTQSSLYLVGVDLELFGKLLAAGLALEGLLELAEGLIDFIEATYFIEGQAHDTALLGQRLEDRLTDPPNGVRDKFKTARFVEALGGLDEAEVTFVDEVGKAEALVLVLFGYRDDEA